MDVRLLTAKALVKGAGLGLADIVAAPLTPPLTVQRHNTETDVSLEGTHDGGDVLKNDAGQFKATHR